MEKFDVLIQVLRSLEDRKVLQHFVLVGSWCLDVYRKLLESPTTIPATRTLDADVLIPKRLPRNIKIDSVQLMEEQGFVTDTDYPSGFHRFVHPQLNFEFLTNAGAKSDVSVHRFKQLGVTVQELRYMNIPLDYPMPVCVEGIDFRVPEPEAFALHKLIVAGLRKDKAKAQKDLEAATGLLLYFEERSQHLDRLRQIFLSLPKGWRMKINKGLLNIEVHVVIPWTDSAS